MAIANKDYASFMVNVETDLNKITGEIDKMDIDFAKTTDASGKDDEGNPVNVIDIKELKAKIRQSNLPDNVKLPSLQKIKKYKSKTKTWGGKALRYKKGQKEGKGGQIMPIEVQNAFRDIAKTEKISISKAINKYQNKKITSRGGGATGQHDIEDTLTRITNPDLLVNVKDSSGKTYRFYGDGKQVWANPNFQKLWVRNMNRVYGAIKGRDKLK